MVLTDQLLVTLLKTWWFWFKPDFYLQWDLKMFLCRSVLLFPFAGREEGEAAAPLPSEFWRFIVEQLKKICFSDILKAVFLLLFSRQNTQHRFKEQKKLMNTSKKSMKGFVAAGAGWTIASFWCVGLRKKSSYWTAFEIRTEGNCSE